MKQIIPFFAAVLLFAASCQKADDIQPIIPVTPPETDTVLPSDPVPALFSIGEGMQVRFAPGNLQYARGVWRFAETQTDNHLPYNADNCDLFNWSTTSTNWGLESTIDVQDYENPFVDWGTNPDIVATYGDGWRVLEVSEWSYLLEDRIVDGQAGEGHSWIAANIDGQYGIILYPDGYTQQTTTLGTIPDSCVFLPAEGCRDGNIIFDRNIIGYYWSATTTRCPTGAAYIKYHQFNSSTLFVFNNDITEQGYSVRLVRDVYKK